MRQRIRALRGDWFYRDEYGKGVMLIGLVDDSEKNEIIIFPVRPDELRAEVNRIVTLAQIANLSGDEIEAERLALVLWAKTGVLEE